MMRRVVCIVLCIFASLKLLPLFPASGFSPTAVHRKHSLPRMSHLQKSPLQRTQSLCMMTQSQSTLHPKPWHRNRFQHRELLLDTSRHFMPVPTMLRIIDSLPFAKVQTLNPKSSIPHPALKMSIFWKGMASTI
jgi:hypothetical protein